MGLLTSIFAASPENPRFNLNDPEAWNALMGGGRSSAGIPVNADVALTYSPWWRGVNLISRSVGKLPLFIYQRAGEGKRLATAHPGYALLRRKPNDFQTSLIFKQQLTAHAINTGNGYAYIFRDGSGRPMELLPLDPNATSALRANGVVWYTTNIAGEQLKIPYADCIHIKGLSFDGLTGYNLVDKAKDSIGLGLGVRKYETIYFKNGAKPAVVLETPTKMNEEAQRVLREGWEHMHAGLDNAHRTAILDSGLTAKVLSFNPDDSQLQALRQLEIREVANWIGIPCHKLSDITRTGYASLEQENESFLSETLDPWLCNWEEECWDKILAEDEKDADNFLVEFLRSGLVVADMAARANYYRVALGGRGWMTQNEVRTSESLNPVPGGDTILDPLNMAAPGGDPNAPHPTAPAAPPEKSVPINQESRMILQGPLPTTEHKALAQVLGDTVRRMVRRTCTQAERAARKSDCWHAHDDKDVLADALAFAGIARPELDLAGWLATAMDRWIGARCHNDPAAIAAGTEAMADQLAAQAIALFETVDS